MVFLTIQIALAGNSRFSTIYKEAVTLTNGITRSSCDADYTNSVKDISRHIASMFDITYNLSNSPDNASLAVKYSEDNEVTYSDFTGFSRSDKTITLTQPILPNSHLKFEYTYGAVEILDTFGSLTWEPASDTVDVYVKNEGAANFSLVAANQYTVDQAGKQIIFNSPPNDKATIRVNYRKNDPLSDTFNIGTEAVSDSISVTVDGSSIGSSFNAMTGDVTLVMTPRDNSEIIISYQVEKPSDAINEYPLTAPNEWVVSEIRGLIGFENGNGDAPVAVSYDNNKKLVVVAPQEFLDGRMIKVFYRDLSTLDQSFSLLNSPLFEKVTVMAGESYECPQEKIAVSNAAVITSCDYLEEVNITISYQVEENRIDRFELKDAIFNDKTKVEVRVNNQKREDFKVADQFLTFDAALEPGSKVIVKVINEKGAKADEKQQEKDGGFEDPLDQLSNAWQPTEVWNIYKAKCFSCHAWANDKDQVLARKNDTIKRVETDKNMPPNNKFFYLSNDGKAMLNFLKSN